MKSHPSIGVFERLATARLLAAVGGTIIPLTVEGPPTGLSDGLRGGGQREESQFDARPVPHRHLTMGLAVPARQVRFRTFRP